jgi:cell volume regulation protein A
MTNYIILALCIVVLLAYIFDITSKYSKIPGVILLIGLGIGIRLLTDNTRLELPNMQPLLPVLGTLGLILIVMEASLDLKLDQKKLKLFSMSVGSAIILFFIFTGLLSYILVRIMGYPIFDSIANSIPLGIISSAVAIPSARNLGPAQTEFIVYESSFSDILGIMAFDFIILNHADIGNGLISTGFNIILTVIIASITTSVLGYLLHKITYHINYVIIMTSVVMVYALAKLIHLPALFLVLSFGLALANSRLVENTPIKRFVDFVKFRNDLDSFRKILVEMTFLVRSFFFIMFGYYTSVSGLFNLSNLIAASVITSAIFVLRFIFFRTVLRITSLPLILFAPRGLITILLFISVPAVTRIPLINTEVITLVIMMTLLVMMIGNLVPNRDKFNALDA